MRLRGSPRHRRIPRDLYDTFRTFVILKASVLGRHTFIERDEWVGQFSDVYSHLLDLISEVPGILEHRNRLVKRPNADFSDLHARAFDVYKKLITWRENIDLDFDLVPGDENGDVFPIVREFKNHDTPVRMTNLFCASMIHLVDCMPGDMVDEEYRTEVCLGRIFAK